VSGSKTCGSDAGRHPLSRAIPVSLKHSPFISRKLFRSLSMHAGRWVFWRTLIRIWLTLAGVFTVIQIPNYLHSVRNDQERVLEIIEDRKLLADQSLARILDLGDRILNATNSLESSALLGLIRGGNPTFPGIISLSTVRNPPGDAGWVVEEEEARDPEFLMSRMISHIEIAPLFQKAREIHRPCMSRIFRKKGQNGGADRTLIAAASPMMTTTSTWRSSDSWMLGAIIDIESFVKQAGVPASLKLINFYLSNEPEDGFFINLNGSSGSKQPQGLVHYPIELGGYPENSLRDFASSVRSPSLVPAPAPSRPSRDARARPMTFDGIEGPPFRISIDIPSEFMGSREGLVKSLTPQLAVMTVISALLAWLWILFSAGQQQVHQLGQAQQTIQRLSLHRSLVQQELHDHIIQNLTLLGIQIAMASPKDTEGFQTIRSVVIHQLDYLRGELRRLLMDGTHRLGSFDEMISQIQSICRNLEAQSDAQCSLTNSNPNQCCPNPEVLFRACRFVEELIGNAIRHGAARRIQISIDVDAGQSMLTIRVVDDGRGFDPDRYSPGYGLQSMAAFARRSKGSLHLERSQTRGMRISLILPFTPTAVRL